MRLHWQWLTIEKPHAGIIIVQNRLSVGEQLRRLARLAATRTPEQMRNRLEFLNDWGEDRPTE